MTTSPDAAIELRGLTKKFGSRVAVNDVTLTIPRGSVYGLVGPNGAGKTTMMRAMIGFTHANAGSSRILGHEMPSAKAEVYPRLGVIIEEPRFFPFLTGRENLRQVASARSETIDSAQIEAALAKVDLADRADDRVKTYSLGMRQRLGIARALLGDPEVLILDEPSNGLDPPGIRDMRLLLRALASEGRTVFVSSHLLGEMEQLCDYVAVLKDGSIIADGAVADLTGSGDEAGAATGTRLLLGVSDVAGARSALAAIDPAPRIEDGDAPNTLSVTFPDEATPTQVELLVALVVGAGIGVHRVQPLALSLEQRFMKIVDAEGIQR
ncbi:MAG: transporter ATP-binding protein [Thermoleophilia bacterium]|nr:transporter ATP-binding protein [Thermoleophilia bacterium]